MQSTISHLVEDDASKTEDWEVFLSQLNRIKDDQIVNDNRNDSHNETEECVRRPIRGRGTHSDEDHELQQNLSSFSTYSSDDHSNVLSPTEQVSQLKELLKSKRLDNEDLDIEVLRLDPNNPLHSAKTFQEMNLKAPLLRGVASMGLYKPSTIQEKALSSLIGQSPQNMIAQSQSGTGKTATFLLAMLSHVRTENAYCQCLCLAPTRELALQIAAVGRRMATFMDGIHIGLAVREHEVSYDADGFVTDQIVIGTPGTVMQWVRGNGPIRLDARKFIVFVLDEADVMMQQEGFLNISRRIKSKLSPSCQILFFSATYAEDVIEFARELVPNPIEIRVKANQLPLKNIKQYYLLFNDWVDKYAAMNDIYGDFEIGQAIVFCETRKEANWLQAKLSVDGHRAVVLSGDLEMVQRQAVLEDFRQAAFRILITTNVCSRGLDIPQVNLVINWNMPVMRSGAVDCETYLHRIGRSGRFGKEGLGVNFITLEEMPLIKELEEHFQIQIPLLTSSDLVVE